MPERFRRARGSDVAAIMEAMAAYYAEEGCPFEPDAARNAVAALAEDETLGALWVVEFGGALFGYFGVTLGYSLEYRGRHAWLDELYVREGARGRGLGAEALELAEAFCRDHGIRTLHLEVARHRMAAFDMYRRHGFVERDRHVLSKSVDQQQRP